MGLFDSLKNTVDYDGAYFRVIAEDGLVPAIENGCGGAKRPTRAEPVWRVPALPFNATKLGRLALTWTEKAAAAGRELIAEAAWRESASKAVDSTLELKNFGMELYPYQKAGVEYMSRVKRVLLSDDVGLGKSAQTLATLHNLGEYPALIICPASLKYWWKQEGERCIKDKRFLVADSKTKPLEFNMADVVIVNYDLLADGYEDQEKKNVKLSRLGQQLFEMPFKAIVMDEMHACKSSKAQRTKAVKKLAEDKPIRIGITGTPITNRPAELIPLAQILGRMNDLGGWLYFSERFCKQKTKYGQYNGAKNLPELHGMMRASFYLRRTKDDAGLKIPPLTRSVVPVEITNRTEYEYAEAEIIKWVKEKAAEDKAFLKKIEHLSPEVQQELIYEHQNNKAAKAKRAEAMIKLMSLKRIAAQGKIQAAKQYIDDFIESGKKLIVFAMHKDLLEALKETYPNSCAILSSMDAKERQDNVNAFQNNGNQLMLGAMGTSAGSSPAGTGHTLTASSHVLILEMSFTNVHHNQLIGRAYRIGQKHNTTAVFLTAKDTIEERVMQLLDGKKSSVEMVTDGVESENTESMIDMLTKQYAA